VLVLDALGDKFSAHPPRGMSGSIDYITESLSLMAAPAIILSISIRNYSATEDFYMCAVDAHAPHAVPLLSIPATPQAPVLAFGESLQSKNGDRQAVKCAADSYVTMSFPRGWLVRSGLALVMSALESRFSTVVALTTAGAYWTVEYYPLEKAPG
jgi:hypothetical protein